MAATHVITLPQASHLSVSSTMPPLAYIPYRPHVKAAQKQTHRQSCLPSALPRASSWPLSGAVDKQNAPARPASLRIINVDKPLPPIPSYSRHGAAHGELFLPPVQFEHENGGRTSSTSPSSTVLEYCILREASTTMHLGNFLNWLHDRYSSRFPVSLDCGRMEQTETFAKDHYHTLLTMEMQYNRHSTTASNGSQAMAHAIRSTLQHLRIDIEKDLHYMDAKHASVSLRDFVLWTYSKFKTPGGRANRQSMLWNPHQITSSSRVVKEAITYFTSPYFTESRGKVSIFAKHIVYLLCGGKDWREGVSPDDALLVYHATPTDR